VKPTNQSIHYWSYHPLFLKWEEVWKKVSLWKSPPPIDWESTRGENAVACYLLWEFINGESYSFATPEDSQSKSNYSPKPKEAVYYVHTTQIYNSQSEFVSVDQTFLFISHVYPELYNTFGFLFLFTLKQQEVLNFVR